eukprot:scaffold38677_cov49-Phaeocystis_antarctica.AAC.2
MRLPADDDDGPPAAADTAVGGDTAGGGGVLGGRAVAALDALASRVVCAAPEWHLEVGTDGALRRTLRLWVGTSCGWLHCCGGALGFITWPLGSATARQPWPPGL